MLEYHINKGEYWGYENLSIEILMGGGLGNQLFQYAAGKSVALDLGTDLEIDFRFFPRGSVGTSKGPWIIDFPIEAQLNWHSSNLGPLGVHGSLRRALRKIVPKKPTFAQDTPSFEDLTDKLSDGSRLYGVLQSHLYFTRHWEELKKHLDLVETGVLTPTDLQVAHLLPEKSTAVHVRRGDYLNVSGFAMERPEEYYRDALHLADREADNVLVVFSDDTEWCKDQEVFEGATFFEGNNDKPPYYDMMAMSLFNTIIIANSTFSWWSGWLGSSRGSQVIAPKIWTHGLSTADIDLLPNGWLSC